MLKGYDVSQYDSWSWYSDSMGQNKPFIKSVVPGVMYLD